VSNFDAEDKLKVTLADLDDNVLSARDFLDSDANGVIDAADRDARLVGQNLVLDMDQLFEREAGVPLELGEQHLVLVGVTSFDTDQLL
jgi:hypothetical protein